jgi:uncharacterized protein YyaL (SSP411 family)
VGEQALRIATTLAPRAPRAAGWGLVAATALLAGPLEVAVVTPDEDASAATWHRIALMGTSPGMVVAIGAGSESEAPLLRDRPAIDGRPTAYVCRGFVCDAPVTSIDDLAASVCARQVEPTAS